MKHSFSTLAVALALCGAAAPASAVPTLTFSASQSQIAVGEFTTITADMNGLGDEVLSAFDLNFVYDNAVLNWNIITYFSFELGIPGIASTNGLPEGNLGLADTSLSSDADLAATQPDSFTLFSFVMQGVGDGSTTFTLGPDADFDRLFVGLNGASLAVDVGSVCVAVGTGSCDNGVPEPATGLLVGAALAAAGASMRRRKAGVVTG